MDFSFLFSVLFSTVTTTQTLHNTCNFRGCVLDHRVYVESCNHMQIINHSPVFYFYEPRLKCEVAKMGYFVSVDLVPRTFDL